MFAAALFTIVRTWKQPKCPSTDEWIKKMWYMYPMDCHSAIKRNEIMPFAAIWIQVEIIILSEVSQKEKDKYWYLCYITDSTYMQNVTHGTNEPIIKQKEASDIEN